MTLKFKPLVQFCSLTFRLTTWMPPLRFHMEANQASHTEHVQNVDNAPISCLSWNLSSLTKYFHSLVYPGKNSWLLSFSCSTYLQILSSYPFKNLKFDPYSPALPWEPWSKQHHLLPGLNAASYLWLPCFHMPPTCILHREGRGNHSKGKSEHVIPLLKTLQWFLSLHNKKSKFSTIWELMVCIPMFLWLSPASSQWHPYHSVTDLSSHKGIHAATF